ncbi:MAG: cytochrome C oxidase subunit IV family protein [Saprospiraceae bacterium]|nr:cytochrome C oxidase subunit IV family protein [Saprospiraceae bacterium]
MAQDYNKAKRGVYMGLLLLGAVTLVEVFLSLFGKGYIISGVESSKILFAVVGIGLVVLSLYKAYFIVYEFMHMGHEVKGLRASVLLPMLLLVWAIIAFFQEGGSWGDRRALIEEKDKIEKEDTGKPTGMLLHDPQTKKLQ